MKTNQGPKWAVMAVLIVLLALPALAEEGMIFIRHFEISLPKREAPKPVFVVLPEEISFRRIPTEKLLLPIEPDPALVLPPDVIE